ncbi:MAG TPA: helix-turn-helix transcriptional regulator [Solirubrobacterales bacterium]
MAIGIGTTLRDARNRRKIDLSEVEAATKIRPRYLRAMENEEWETLPGPTYTRSFIRTYANFLGLDGERLADDYRREAGEPPPGERLPRAEPAIASRGRWERLKLPRGALAVVVSLTLVAVLVVVGLTGGSDSGSPGSVPSTGPAEQHRSRDRVSAQASPPQVSVRLVANAEVWVCLLDAEGQPLVDGQILVAGAEEGPFRSGSFTVSFGNGEVSMSIDGQQASIPATSSPIGYTIGEDGELSRLSETERPTCT